MYNSDGLGVNLDQEGSVITTQCQAETDVFIINGIPFISTHLKGSRFRYLRLMPTGNIDSFLLSHDGFSRNSSAASVSYPSIAR